MFSWGPRGAEHDGVVRIGRNKQKISKEVDFGKKMTFLSLNEGILAYEVAFVGVFAVKYMSVVYQNVRLDELSLMVQRSPRDSMTKA